VGVYLCETEEMATRDGEVIFNVDMHDCVIYMYVYIRVYIYTYIYIYIHTYTYALPLCETAL
jgi:hypothetical protein